MKESGLDESTRTSLNRLYTRLEDEIKAAGPVCIQRGDCCNFDKVDHVLFATTLELQNIIDDKGSDAKVIASANKLCPFWNDGKCGARNVRPLGCRVFFCDSNYRKNHSQPIYEKYHAELEALAHDSEIEYAYVPMVAGLRRFSREGRFYDPARPYSFE